MLFVIHAVDRAGALPTRLARHEAHKAITASRAGIQRHWIPAEACCS